MEFTTLISTGELAACLDDPRLVVIDCRFDLKDVGWGREAYEAAHVPGARYAHLDRDLSGSKNGTNGRHPLPAPEAFAATLGRWGATNDSQIVAYDQDTGSWASRLWWMARWLGHDRVAVLEGGFARWVLERRPTTRDVADIPRRHFEPHIRGEMLVTIEGLADEQRRGATLLDARAPERYRGEIEPLDQRPGHIPGAANYFYMRNLNEAGNFLPRETLTAALHDATGGAQGDHVVCYCGSGVTACHTLLALEHVGIRGAKLYAGSWSEYSADPSRPVATTER
jgi:thiosulfate/3-mercaptopyruvate sulfurtransferase